MATRLIYSTVLVHAVLAVTAHYVVHPHGGASHVDKNIDISEAHEKDAASHSVEINARGAQVKPESVIRRQVKLSDTLVGKDEESASKAAESKPWFQPFGGKGQAETESHAESHAAASALEESGQKAFRIRVPVGSGGRRLCLTEDALGYRVRAEPCKRDNHRQKWYWTGSSIKNLFSPGRCMGVKVDGSYGVEGPTAPAASLEQSHDEAAVHHLSMAFDCADSNAPLDWMLNGNGRLMSKHNHQCMAINEEEGQNYNAMVLPCGVESLAEGAKKPDASKPAAEKSQDLLAEDPNKPHVSKLEILEAYKKVLADEDAAAAKKLAAKKPDAKKLAAKTPLEHKKERAAAAKKPDAKKPDAEKHVAKTPEEHKKVLAAAAEKPDAKKHDAKKPEEHKKVLAAGARKPDAKKRDAKKLAPNVPEKHKKVLAAAAKKVVASRPIAKRPVAKRSAAKKPPVARKRSKKANR